MSNLNKDLPVFFLVTSPRYMGGIFPNEKAYKPLSYCCPTHSICSTHGKKE